MATYHFNAQVVSRSCGASAVAGAAYRSGECLTDERTGEEHDHTDRDDLDAAEILAPRESPAWAQDRARLWNEVEAAERRKDAQVARPLRASGVAFWRQTASDGVGPRSPVTGHPPTSRPSRQSLRLLSLHEAQLRRRDAMGWEDD